MRAGPPESQLDICRSLIDLDTWLLLSETFRNSSKKHAVRVVTVALTQALASTYDLIAYTRGEMCSTAAAAPPQHSVIAPMPAL
jgi:hypothetical protein